jgi:electron transport complex protein RnfG
MTRRDTKPRRVATSGALLGLVAVLGTALLAGVYHLTGERIAEQERLMVQRQLDQVLPRSEYDNVLLEDHLLIRDAEFFRHGDPVRVYRARRQGQPVAVVLNHVAPDGYNGDIRLLTGIRADGTLSGVRVITHRETPGLGDPIDIERSDWILGFNGASLTDPAPEQWGVKRDGGAVDHFTGATITPRAVVKAVQRALEYHQRHAEALYRAAAENPGDG